KGDWGAGSVMLVELPTDSETNDNIVAFWSPAEPARARMHYARSYRLRWLGGEPFRSDLARVVDSWRGDGGRPGQPVVRGATKVVLDFEGPALKGLDRTAVRADVSLSRGSAVFPSVAYPLEERADRWRLMVDILPSGGEPVEMRAMLRRGETPVS